MQGPWVRVDQTEVVYDNTSPKFAKQVIIDYRFEETQHLRVILWDAGTLATSGRGGF